MSGSHTPCPPECNFQSETKIEPDIRLFFGWKGGWGGGRGVSKFILKNGKGERENGNRTENGGS